MNIEVGDVVKLNNGEVHKVDRMMGNDPGRVDECGVGPFVIYGSLYHQDGRFGYKGFGHPLSVKRIISRASDDTQSSQEGSPPLSQLGDPNVHFCDLCQPHRDLLCAAHEEGKTIEYWSVFRQEWVMDIDFDPIACDDYAYRIKPDDTPKLWRDMTDGEKGALLLADHKGAAIHVWEPIAEAWRPLDFGEFMFLDDKAYRVKPEPVRETVTLMIDDGSMGGPQAIGIIDLIDGEPDCSSIKMEKV